MKTALLTLATLASLWSMPSAHAGPADDARAAAARGDRAAAIEAWRAAIIAEPQVVAHYQALGREQLRARDPAGAIATFQQLVEAVPGHARGRYRLAFALRKAGRLDDAAAAYRDYIAVAPADPDGHFGLARTLEKLGKGAEALPAYARYVELETRPSEARWVEEARARIAALAPSAAKAPAPVVATPPAAAAPAAGPTAATREDTDPDRVRAQGELLADSPVTQATAAADPAAAFAAGRHAEAAAGYLVQLSQADQPGTRYRAAVAAMLAGDAVLAGELARGTLAAAPRHPASRRLARASAAELVRRREGMPAPISIESALRENRLRTAARLAARAIDTAEDPEGRAALQWARGQALARLGRYDEAITALKFAAGDHPADARLWADLGDVAERRGDATAAHAFRALAAAVAPVDHPLTTAHHDSTEGR